MKENITDEYFIGLICNGSFNSLPSKKIGEMFEAFFDNINYNVIKEKDKIYVDFTGNAINDKKPCTIVIRFRIFDNAEEFEIEYVKLDEIYLEDEEILDLLEDIAYIAGAIPDEDEDGMFNYEDEYTDPFENEDDNSQNDDENSDDNKNDK